jgi:hypothetical protein
VLAGYTSDHREWLVTWRHGGMVTRVMACWNRLLIILLHTRMADLRQFRRNLLSQLVLQVGLTKR